MRDDDIILTCIPQRVATHEVADDGNVIVFQPRFTWGPAQRLAVYMKKPFVRVRLDATGSFFWLQCDGERTVKAIASAGKKQFGDKLADPQPRVVEFFRTLARVGFVRLQRP
jgi:hypothetical protein